MMSSPLFKMMIMLLSTALMACVAVKPEEHAHKSAQVDFKQAYSGLAAVESRAFRMVDPGEILTWNERWSEARTELNDSIRNLDITDAELKPMIDEFIQVHGLIYGTERFETIYQRIYSDVEMDTHAHKETSFRENSEKSRSKAIP
jgi:hypothetical protein